MLAVIIGALSAIAGGFLATWYQANSARKIRKAEVIAEEEVKVAMQAFTLITELRTILNTQTTADAQTWINGKDDWFFNTALLHPGKFAGKWRSIRAELGAAAGWEASLTETIDVNRRKELVAMYSERLTRARTFADEALAEVYKSMGREPIKLELAP